MRKLIVFNLISIDGFFADSNGGLDWQNTDEEFGQFCIEQTAEFSTMIFGRRTYEIMVQYWPTEEALKNDSEVAALMNKAQKIVFSKTITDVSWNNTTLYHDNVESEIRKIKQQEGGPIVIFGSGTIVSQLATTDLIDEYRLLVNPIILGEGKPLFEHISKKISLDLADIRTFKNGNILLRYLTK